MSTGSRRGGWLGYLQDFPDYWTQGETLDDLKDHLRDLYADAPPVGSHEDEEAV